MIVSLLKLLFLKWRDLQGDSYYNLNRNIGTCILATFGQALLSTKEPPSHPDEALFDLLSEGFGIGAAPKHATEGKDLRPPWQPATPLRARRGGAWCLRLGILPGRSKTHVRSVAYRGPSALFKCRYPASRQNDRLPHQSSRFFCFSAGQPCQA